MHRVCIVYLHFTFLGGGWREFFSHNIQLNLAFKAIGPLKLKNVGKIKKRG